MNLIGYLMDGNFSTAIFVLLSGLFVLFITLPIHEWAHAFAANKLGDPTAKYQGRLSVNPFRHLDPIGSMLLIFFGFGWAKPVPVNQLNFKNPKRDMAITALAGPLSNLIMAFIIILIWQITGLFFQNYFLSVFFLNAAAINIHLAIFNLLPVPPLDGSRLLTSFLPDKYYYKIQQYEQLISIVVLVLVITGALSKPISILSDVILNGFYNLLDLIFSPLRIIFGA